MKIRLDRETNDGSATGWAVYPAETPDEEILADFPPAYYGGPGMGFARRVYIRRTNTRALATQEYGLDI